MRPCQISEARLEEERGKRSRRLPGGKSGGGFARAQPDVPPVQITSSRAVARAHCPVSVRNGRDIDSYALLDSRPAPRACVLARARARAAAHRRHLHTWLHVADPAELRRLHLYIFMYLSGSKGYVSACTPFFSRCFTLRSRPLRAIYRVTIVL